MLLFTHFLAQIKWVMNNCCCLWPQWCFLVLPCPDERQWGFLCLALTLFRICDCSPDYPNVLPKSNFTFRAEHWYAFTHMTGANTRARAGWAPSRQCPSLGRALSMPCLLPLSALQWLTSPTCWEGEDPGCKHHPWLKQPKTRVFASSPSPPLQQCLTFPLLLPGHLPKSSCLAITPRKGISFPLPQLPRC